MNLAIRNINSQFVAWNTEGTFLKDMNPDLKADYILANPPFNQSEWGQDILQEDGRWKYGVPPAGNANFGWMQHMLYHLAPHGVMATVLANGSLSSNTSGEGEIRKSIVQADLVDCIVALPKQLFYNTGIPATIWILRRGKEVRRGETLFIDASEMGFMKDRVHREFAPEDIETIEQAYHSWRKDEDYEDIKGFCKASTLADIEKHSFVLTPGRYVGSPNEESDGVPFDINLSVINNFIKRNTVIERRIDNEISSCLNKYFPAFEWGDVDFSSNTLLENLAKMIFKEWFVNFNYPDATGEMVDSELGEIPKGWRVGKLGEEFDITIGRTPPRKEQHWFSKVPTGKKWSSIKDIVNSGLYLFETSEYITDEAISKFNIPVIPEGTVILSFKMTVGKLAITTEEMLSNEAIAHMKIKAGSYLISEYIYLFLHGLDFNSLGSTSSIVTAINSTMIKQIQLLVPDEVTMKSFEELIKPIFEKIKNNSSQIQELSKTRDALLPELMGGEVSVQGVTQ